jgi:tetratricopeptide (TPR) repeat protein
MLNQARQCAHGLALFVLLSAAFGASWAQQGQTTTAPWYEFYERGVTLVEQGQGREARAAIEEALRIKADEGLALPTEGPRYVDYLPHLYLAVACHMAGDLAAARSHSVEAERSGLAAKSEAGKRLLATIRPLLDAPGDLAAATTEATPEPPTQESPARFTVFDRKPVVLSDSEFERLQKDVLSRCRLSTAAARPGAPWYYHYELGLELERRGDNQRALDALIEAAHRKPASELSARTYGMWFLDYLPYLAIAKAHARLGNRECALDALAVSQRFGETKAQATEVRNLLSDLEAAN